MAEGGRAPQGVQLMADRGPLTPEFMYCWWSTVSLFLSVNHQDCFSSCLTRDPRPDRRPGTHSVCVPGPLSIARSLRTAAGVLFCFLLTWLFRYILGLLVYVMLILLEVLIVAGGLLLLQAASTITANPDQYSLYTDYVVAIRLKGVGPGMAASCDTTPCEFRAAAPQGGGGGNVRGRASPHGTQHCPKPGKMGACPPPPVPLSGREGRGPELD